MNDTTRGVSEHRDEDLMAYADGTLPLPQAEAIRRAAATNPTLAARIAMYRRSREVLQAAFSDTLDAPVPERLLALFDADADAVAAGSAARPPEIPAPPLGAHRSSRRRARGWPLALAASVLLTVLVSVLHRPADPADPADPAAGSGAGVPVAAALPLDALTIAALEQNLSGEPRTDGEPSTREVMPLATYVDGEGRYCRAYETTDFASGAPSSSRARACREGAGWQASETSVAAIDAPVDTYAPASGQGGVAGQIVDAATEAALIAGGWQR